MTLTCRPLKGPSVVLRSFSHSLHVTLLGMGLVGAWASAQARCQPILDARFAGSVAVGNPEQIVGEASLTSLTTADGTFTNLQGAIANGVLTALALNALGPVPASANAVVTGLSVQDGVNNLVAGNFQFTNGFDDDTVFYILESTPQSSDVGDPTTITLIDAANTAVGTYSLSLVAGNFTASPANTTNNAIASLTYTSGQGNPVQKLGGVTFTLDDFSGSGNPGLATGIRVVGGSTLDPNVIGICSATGVWPPAPLPPARPPVDGRVLFVGNSYTHGSFAPLIHYNHESITDINGTGYGGVAGMFKQLTVSAGLNYEVTIEAVSGESLAWHLANKSNVIFQAHWDKIFLQEMSSGPLPTERGGKLPAFQSAVAALAQGIHAAQPQAEVYLYETFPRSGFTYESGQRYFGEPIEAMGRDLHDAYFGMLKLEPSIHAVSPAGDAWLQSIQQGVADRNPYDGIDPGKVNLWAADNHHASEYGCYLNALVLFGSATGLDPRTLGYEQTAMDLGLASNTAIRLQQMAYQALAESPSTKEHHGSNR